MESKGKLYEELQRLQEEFRSYSEEYDRKVAEINKGITEIEEREKEEALGAYLGKLVHFTSKYFKDGKNYVHHKIGWIDSKRVVGYKRFYFGRCVDIVEEDGEVIAAEFFEGNNQMCVWTDIKELVSKGKCTYKGEMSNGGKETQKLWRTRMVEETQFISGAFHKQAEILMKRTQETCCEAIGYLNGYESVNC